MSYVYRILFVDDEEGLRITTKAILESQGYYVVCARDGLEGLEALKETLPDLVISDLQMPNMNGFEFLSVVRRRFPKLPVIAISGEFRGIDIPGSVFADAFFEKSNFTADQLIARIADLIGKSAIRHPIKKPSAQLRIVRRGSSDIA
jgi:CheY-like chemotaxis protein